MAVVADFCFACFGTGELKAMQMAMTYDKGPIRDEDKKVKCEYCNGTGVKT